MFAISSVIQLFFAILILLLCESLSAKVVVILLKFCLYQDIFEALNRVAANEVFKSLCLSKVAGRDLA